MNMSNWIYTIKTVLKCDRFTRNEIRNIICRECLVSDRKIFGSYVIDGQKVWDKIVVFDRGVMEKLQSLNIYDHIGIESLYSSIMQHKYRIIKTRNCSKRRR